MRTLGPLVDRAAAPAARSDAAFDAAASSSVHLGPKAKRAGFGVPEGFVPDPKSGYYYSAESGYYFDASSKLYFHGTTQQWYSSDPITGQLRPYFALPNVLDGLFSLCKRLFGVDIVPGKGDAPLWHEDVQFFDVNDESTGERVASFYLDPYARPENKRGGAWMDVCVGKSQKLDRLPVAYLTCNGSPPVEGKPSLMTFNEVETLYHEMGHGLQHMLTRRAEWNEPIEIDTFQPGFLDARREETKRNRVIKF